MSDHWEPPEDADPVIRQGGGPVPWWDLLWPFLVSVGIVAVGALLVIGLQT